jgi:hypothetical protein
MRDAFAQSRFARRCFAGGRTFALLILALATVDRAQAANNCDATAPIDNTIITCSGATVNANGTDQWCDVAQASMPTSHGARASKNTITWPRPSCFLTMTFSARQCREPGTRSWRYPNQSW